MWSHTRADPGHTCWVDVEPLRAPPRVRWAASPFGHVSDLMAGPQGVVVAPTFCGVPARVLDPATGAVRHELHGTTWCHLEEDRLVPVRGAPRSLIGGEPLGPVTGPRDSSLAAEVHTAAGWVRFEVDSVKRGRTR